MNIKNKKILVSLFVIVIAIVGLIGYKIWIVNSKQVKGVKEYTLVIKDSSNNYKKEYEFNTEEISLGKDLDSRDLIKTDNNETSRFVTSVDGKEADALKQQWWNIKINGEDSKTGVDDIMINNGDKIEFVLTNGW